MLSLLTSDLPLSMLILLFVIISCHQCLCTIIFSKADVDKIILSDYSIQSTQIPHFHLGRDDENKDCHHLKVNLSNVNYDLCIKIAESVYPELINETTPIFMPNRNGSTTFSQLSLKLVRGYALGLENTSLVKGYLHEDYFYGKVQILDDVYYVEPALDFDITDPTPKDNDSILYKKPNSSFFDQFNKTFSFGFDIFNINMGVEFGRPHKMNGKLCVLTIVVDNSFIETIGGGSMEKAINRILFNFDEVNAILRSADFDGDRVPDNIGITIGLVAGLNSSDPKLGGISFTPIDKPVNPLEILQRFATFTIVRQSCLNILLIGQPFIEQYLGVSFTATKNIFDRFKNVGICAGNSIFTPSLNSLVVTYKFGNGEMLPKPLVDINLVHEIAHSFGSDHDEGNCLKGYIMSPKTAIPSMLENFEFSPCSKRDISAVLRKQGDCLLDISDPFCGNGILESNEECDCGSSYHCSLKDPCCHPRDSSTPCKVNRNAYECHPSEDLCCSSKCTYKNLSNLGLDCTNIKNKCPCSEEQQECICGIGGTCLGNECHSHECTRIGLKECLCPLMIGDTCQTCCLSHAGLCLSAIAVTTQLIKADQNFSLISNISFTSSTIGGENTICNDNNCFHFQFYSFPDNEFCTFRGKIGVCIKGRCTLPAYVSHRFPSIQKSVENTENGGGKYFVFLIDIVVILFAINKFLF